MNQPTAGQRLPASSVFTRRRALGLGLTAAATAVAAPALAACGPSGDGGTTAGSTASVADAVPTYTPFPNKPKPDLPGTSGGALDAYLHYPADPKPVTTGIPGDGKPIKGLAQLNAAPPTPLPQNSFWQELNTRLGSPLEIQLVNAGDDFNSKIATLSAGDDFPDMMQVNGSIPSLGPFLKAKMLDLTPYLAGDKANDYPALANIPTMFWEPCVFDGTLRALPISRGMLSSLVTYYRTDVLEAAGVTAPLKNWEEIVAAAKEINAPKESRFGFGTIPLQMVRQMLGIPNGWHEVNGSLVHQLEDERQTEALEAVRKLQSDGLMHPELATAPPAQQQGWFGTGLAGFYAGTFSAWPSLALNFKVPADALQVLPVVGFADGTTPSTWMGNANNNITVIPASAKDRVETLLKVANYLASPFGTAEQLFLSRGIEGKHFTFDGTDPRLLPDAANELALGFGYMACPPQVLYNADVPGYAEREHAAQVEFAKTASIDLSQKYYSETSSRKGPALGKAQTAAELDIIYGRQPVSSWSDFVAKWRSDGGDKIREEIAAAKAGQ